MVKLPVQFASVIAMVLAIALAGCASGKGDSAKGKPGSAAARRAAPRSEFETTRDPPIASDTRFAAGQLAESRGSLAQAADQYRHVLRNNPRHHPAMYRLGIVYAGMKKYPDAIAVWKRYLQATGDSAAGYSNLAFCYELAGKPEEAETTYLKGIRKDPRHLACRVNYGLMLVRRGRVNEGMLQLGAVLTAAEVRYNVASVYESMGRREHAKAEYKKALELDPSFADAQTRLDELQGTTSTQSNVPMAPTASTEPPARTEPTAPTGLSQTDGEPVEESSVPEYSSPD